MRAVAPAHAQLRRERLVVEHALDGVGQPTRVPGGVEPRHDEPGVGAHFEQCGSVGVHDGRTEPHGFEGGQAEAVGDAGHDDDGGARVGEREVGVVERAEGDDAAGVEVGLVLDLGDLVGVDADEHEGHVGCMHVAHRPQQVGDAFSLLERPDGEGVALGEAEGVSSGIRVDGHGEVVADSAGDDADALAHVDDARQLVAHGVRGYDDGVGVALGALGHGLVPRDGARAHGLGVRPRRGLVHGDDELLTGVVEPVVAVEGREQAGGVHHAAAGEAREAVLPGGGELAPVEGALVQGGEAGQRLLDARVVVGG